jgi:hypothetical protein
VTIDEARILFFLFSRGDRHTAKEIHQKLSPGVNRIWEPLIKMEKEGLVYKAFTYEDWTTFHKWKITGCGALQLHFPILPMTTRAK